MQCSCYRRDTEAAVLDDDSLQWHKCCNYTKLGATSTSPLAVMIEGGNFRISPKSVSWRGQLEFDHAPHRSTFTNHIPPLYVLPCVTGCVWVGASTLRVYVSTVWLGLLACSRLCYAAANSPVFLFCVCVQPPSPQLTCVGTPLSRLSLLGSVETHRAVAGLRLEQFFYPRRRSS